MLSPCQTLFPEPTSVHASSGQYSWTRSINQVIKRCAWRATCGTLSASLTSVALGCLSLTGHSRLVIVQVQVHSLWSPLLLEEMQRCARRDAVSEVRSVMPCHVSYRSGQALSLSNHLHFAGTGLFFASAEGVHVKTAEYGSRSAELAESEVSADGQRCQPAGRKRAACRCVTAASKGWHRWWKPEDGMVVLRS